MFEDPTSFRPLLIDREDLYNLDTEGSSGFPAHLPFREGRQICARPSQLEDAFEDPVEWTAGQVIVAQTTKFQTAWCMVEAVEQDEAGRVHLLLKMLAIHDEW